MSDSTFTFILPEVPEPPSNVFALAGPQDMLWKLDWEIAELDRSLGFEKNRFPRRHPAFHAYNCAVTAWHLCDWTWQASETKQRRILSERFGFALVSDDRKNLERFCDAICSAREELRVCRQIANGSKHMKLGKPDPSVTTHADWVRVIEPAGPLKKGDLMLHLRVKVGATEITARDLFRNAFRFWENLLADLGFVEGTRYIQGRPLPAPSALK